MAYFKKLSIFFLLGIFILLTSIHTDTYACIGGTISFLKINSVYTLPNPNYSGESKINISQDISSSSYITDKPIDFLIDTSILPYPDQVINLSVFRWYFSTGDNFQNPDKNYHYGRETSFTFKKTGSYLVTIEMQNSATQNTFNILDTVQINIPPFSHYTLPSPSILIGGDSFQPGSVLTFAGNISNYESNKNLWDFNNGQIYDTPTKDYSYSTTNYNSFLYHRVIDKNGISNDIRVSVQPYNGNIAFYNYGDTKRSNITLTSRAGMNSLLNQKLNKQAPSSQNNLTTSFTFIFLYLGIFLLVALITIRYIFIKRGIWRP